MATASRFGECLETEQVFPQCGCLVEVGASLQALDEHRVRPIPRWPGQKKARQHFEPALRHNAAEARFLVPIGHQVDICYVYGRNGLWGKC